MCQAFHDQFNCNFSSVMPCNLFGINDKFSDNNSHVIPALIKKFHNAKVKNKKKVEVWGSGKVKREFLFSEDSKLYFISGNFECDNLIGKSNILESKLQPVQKIISSKYSSCLFP